MKFNEFKVTVKLIGKAKEEYQISSSASLYPLLVKLFDRNTILWTEELILICLNTNQVVTGYYRLSKGGRTNCIVDTRVIFTVALGSNATRIILAHNHPSGLLRPTQADKDVTKKVKEAGQLLDIILIDHLIVTQEGYFSFADEGYL
jgi:DNA repair protein RadC